MSDYTKVDLLSKFPADLRKFVVELWKDKDIGLCGGGGGGDIQVTNILSTKCEDLEREQYSNCFTVRIPYAGHHLHWEVIFNNDDYTFCPDFYFDDDSFLCDPDIDVLVRYVPSLNNWNYENPKSLMNVIKEFLNLYKKHQIKKLEDDRFSRIHFEYSSLFCETGLSTEDVEVLVESSDVVHFLIAIPVDYSGIPPYIQLSDTNFTSDNPSHDTSMILVTFLKLDGSKTHPQLFLSPNVQQILSGLGPGTLPSWSTESCLMDYIPAIRKWLSNKIERICNNYRMKNEYITFLLVNHPYNIVEYDSLAFSKVTLLFETKNFHWLLIITIGNNFLEEKPKWTLRSVYNVMSGDPFTESLEDYPYSPRWSCEEMVQRAFTYMVEHISIFHTSSTKNSQI